MLIYNDNPWVWCCCLCVQVLSATLGSASRDLIHTGLLTLCDVTQDVDTDVRHTALLTLDRVLAETRPQIR